jgi:hypothetical protein
MLKKALLIAFARGVGGGLSLAAVPWILAGGTWVVRKSAGQVVAMGKWSADAGDALRYYRELRGHRAWMKSPVNENDGLGLGQDEIPY